MARASADDRSLRVDRFVAENQAALARNGAVRESWRTRDGRRAGPYYRLECRMAGRKVAVYLGSDGPLAAAVRERLAQLRQPRSEIRRRASLEKKLWQMSQDFRARLAEELQKVGLRLHGAEIRGYRASSLRGENQTAPQSEN